MVAALTTPWSVKGVSEDAKQTAKRLSQQSNKTMGSWLSDLILSQPSPATPQKSEKEMANLILVLAKRIAVLEKTVEEHVISTNQRLQNIENTAVS
jgi:hypothetical protein